MQAIGTDCSLLPQSVQLCTEQIFVHGLTQQERNLLYGELSENTVELPESVSLQGNGGEMFSFIILRLPETNSFPHFESWSLVSSSC